MQWLIDGYNVMHAAGLIEGRTGRSRFRLARRRFLNEMAAALGPLVHDTTVVFDASMPPGDFPIESVYKGITVIFALADEDADSRIERIVAHHSSPKALTVVSTDRRVRLAATRRKAHALRADDFLDRMTTLAHERPKPSTSEKPDAKPPAALMDDAEKAHWQEVFGSIDVEAAAESLAPKPTGAEERPRPRTDQRPKRKAVGRTAPKPPEAAMDDAEKAHWQQVFGSIDDEAAAEFLDPKPTGAQERPRPKVDQRPKPKAAGRPVAKPKKAATDDAEKAHWQKVFGSIDDDPAVRKAFRPDSTLLTDAEIAEIQREIDREP